MNKIMAIVFAVVCALLAVAELFAKDYTAMGACALVAVTNALVAEEEK